MDIKINKNTLILLAVQKLILLKVNLYNIRTLFKSIKTIWSNVGTIYNSISICAIKLRPKRELKFLIEEIFKDLEKFLKELYSFKKYKIFYWINQTCILISFCENK